MKTAETLTSICPECGHLNEHAEVKEGWVRCSACEKWSVAGREENTNILRPPEPVEPIIAKRTAEDELLEAQEKIRRKADAWTGWAIFIFVIGLIVAVVDVVGSVGGGECSITGFIVAGAFISTAFWFYLVAQIIHIRANTEK